ncbi:MAG: hypothetical protein PHT79_10965 [Syntrophomonadaceae bacterium]|nr:hypothetical protein [Syntrophomonadaceae bacterium]MDD3889443.1 hypothetical protein [Syntrophomonadaceae bacterium]MDD4550265.1 hypothetical protein [Syntrophomonadaceae bacterium]
MAYNNYYNTEEKITNNLNRTGKAGLNILKRKGLKVFLKLIKPILPAILTVLAIVLLILFIIGLIFWAAPQGELYTGPKHTKEDDKLKAYCEELCNENNIKDRWLVSGHSSVDGLWHDKISDNRKIPGASSYEEVIKHNKRILQDRYNRDIPLLETFGQLQAASVFYIMTYGLNETSDEFKAQVAEDFRPYIYYKKSTVTTCCEVEDEDGGTHTECDTDEVFLMVEANTIQGHFLYKYEWVTDEGKT